MLKVKRWLPVRFCTTTESPWASKRETVKYVTFGAGLGAHNAIQHHGARGRSEPISVSSMKELLRCASVYLNSDELDATT